MKYEEMQEKFKEQFGKTLKSCWIADVKRELGIPTRISPNRINLNSVKYPCPEGEIKNWLKKILTNYK